MMERLRAAKGLLVITALMATFFLASCDDSEDEPEVFVGKSTTLEDGSLSVGADGALSGGTFSTVDGTGNATGVAVLEVENGTLAYRAANVFAEPGFVELVMTVSDWDSEPTFIDGDFTVAPDPDGNTSEVTTGGFVDVYMVDAGGERIRAFGQNLTITLDVTNPDVEEGDLVEIWMYDDGEWKIHAPEVNVYDDGGLKVKFTTDHLTFFAIVIRADYVTGSGGTTT